MSRPDPGFSPHTIALSRRHLLQLGTGVAAAAVLAGCGKSSSSGNSAAGGTLTLGLTSDLFPALTAPLATYSSQGKWTVKVREMPADTGAYLDQMRTQLQGGSADIDVFVGDVSWPAQLGSRDWISDLTSRFSTAEQREFLPGAVAGNNYQGKLYGVPCFTDVGLLYYRKDLLEKSGFSAPPTTWAELQEMALKVTKDQRIPNGFTFTGAAYEGGTLLGMEFIRTAGGTIIDGDSVTVNSPAAIQGLQLERSMVTTGISPQAVADYQEGDAETPFVSGKAVFLRNWAYVFGDLKDKGVSSIEAAQVGVTGIPRVSASISPINVGGGWNLYINAASKNQDAAWDLVQFISSAAQQKHTAETIGYLPTRSALYDDAALIKSQPAIAQGKTEIAQTVTPPVSPYYQDMSRVMSREFNKSLRGDSTPEQAAQTVQQQLEAIVKAGK
jgi:multiple sugar transport system substrate-binding protein